MVTGGTGALGRPSAGGHDGTGGRCSGKQTATRIDAIRGLSVPAAPRRRVPLLHGPNACGRLGRWSGIVTPTTQVPEIGGANVPAP
jgi:hypothetical protein